MKNQPFSFSIVIKGVIIGVLLMLSLVIGSNLPEMQKKRQSSNLETLLIEIEAKDPVFISFETISTFRIPLGSHENQIGFLPYQDRIEPGFAQGALPTEFYPAGHEDVWIGDPYGPRLTKWDSNGFLQASLELPFLRNEASKTEKELVGFTVKPASDGSWIILDNQSKKLYCIREGGQIDYIISIPLVFSDRRVVLNISPFFEVINHNWIFVTVESAFQPLSVKTGFAGGLYLDTVWESYFVSLHGAVIGPISEDTSLIALPNGLATWSYHGKSLDFMVYSDPTEMVQPIKVCKINQIRWNYGGFIGTDRQGRLFYWADRGMIGRIDLLRGTVHLITLPDKNVFPVAVSPEGDIGWIKTEKQWLLVSVAKLSE